MSIDEKTRVNHSKTFRKKSTLALNVKKLEYYFIFDKTIENLSTSKKYHMGFLNLVKKNLTFMTVCRIKWNTFYFVGKNMNNFYILSVKLKIVCPFVGKSETLFTFCQKKK